MFLAYNLDSCTICPAGSYMVDEDRDRFLHDSVEVVKLVLLEKSTDPGLNIQLHNSVMTANYVCGHISF